MAQYMVGIGITQWSDVYVEADSAQEAKAKVQQRIDDWDTDMLDQALEEASIDRDSYSVGSAWLLDENGNVAAFEFQDDAYYE